MISLVQRTIDAHGGTPFFFAMDGVATEELNRGARMARRGGA